MSEWEIEPKTGRRFRRVGSNGIEYEREISIAGGISIPESQLADFNRREKERQERERREALERMRNAPPRRGCPFGDGAMQRDCRGEKCAIYIGDRCALAQTAAAQATEGRACPFSPYKCNTKCALYNNGCSLTNLFTERKQEENE